MNISLVSGAHYFTELVEPVLHVRERECVCVCLRARAHAVCVCVCVCSRAPVSTGVKENGSQSLIL